MSDFSSLFSITSAPKIRGGRKGKLRGGDGSSSCDGGMIALIVVVIIILLIAIGMACCYGCYGGSSGSEKLLYYDKETGKLVAGSRFRKDKKSRAMTAAEGKAAAQEKAAAARGKAQAHQGQHVVPASASAGGSGKVTTLQSQQELEQLLGSGVPTIVFIHMDGCGFCNRAKEQVFNQYLAMRHPYAKLCDINVRNCSDFCRAHNVDGFPTFVTNYEDGGLKFHVGFKAPDIMDQIVAKAQGVRAVVSPMAAPHHPSPHHPPQHHPSQHHPSQHMRAVVSPTSDEEPVAGGAVKDMTAAEALQLFKSKKPTVVAVVAPWCGFCKKLKEEHVFDKLKAAFPQITFGFVDGTAEQNKAIVETLSKENGGRFGYPTILHSFVPANSTKVYEVVSGYRPFEAFHQLLGEKLAGKQA